MRMTKSKKQFIEKYGELGKILLKMHSSRLEAAKDRMENLYLGEFNSREDFIESFMEDRANELLAFDLRALYKHCNWEAFTKDVFTYGFIDIEVGKKIHVFHLY